MKRAKQMLAGLLAAVLAITALPAAVAAEITEITWGTKPADGTTEGQPFPSGTGGSQNFRIPGIVTLDDGTLVASADARWNHGGDACGLDTIVSRSTDNGANWNYTFANYLGDYGNNYHANSTAFIDPAITTDGENIYMIADVWPGGYAINTAPNRPLQGNEFDEDGNLRLSGDNRKTYAYHLERNMAEDADENSYYVIKENVSGDIVAGYTIDAYFNITEGSDKTNLFCDNSPYLVYPTDYLYLTKSKDGGATWSVPTLLRMKKPTEKTLLVGPGRGIVTSTGRIVFTAYEFTDGDRNSACIYSDDGGLTWERGASVPQVSSEAAIVEADGRLYIFTRHGGYNVSDDWGETWSEKKTPDGITYNLGCELSAITYSKKIDGKTAIIFSAPSNTGSRAAGKLFVGLVESDGTISWDYEYSVNGEAYYAYSCITELKDGSIGLLYENAGAGITYTNILITDILGENAAVTDGPWCEDGEGKKINSIQMKSNSSIELGVFSASDHPVWSVASSNEELLRANIADGKLKIISGNFTGDVSRETLILSDGTSELYLQVVISEVSSYMPVKLRMGDVKNYTIADDAVVDRTDLDESIANVSVAANRMKIEGIAEGKTSVKVGNRVYFITVQNDVREIKLDKGESIVVKGEKPDLNTNRKVILIEDNTNPYPYEPAETITDGEYLIGTATHIVTSGDSSAKNPLGRAMQPADFEAADLSDYLWTITKMEGGYTLQNKEGKYLEFKTASGESCEVNVSDEPQTLQILDKYGTFAISNGTHYLNNFGNGNVRAAGYNQDNNSWYFYQTDKNSYVIKGNATGKVYIVGCGINYDITVGEPDEEVEAVFANLDNQMTEAKELLAKLEQSGISAEYTEASITALNQAYAKVREIMDSKEDQNLKALRDALAELQSAMQLEKKEEIKDPPKKQQDLPAPGSIQPYGDASYKVLTATAAGGTVSYVKPAKKTAKVKIPDSILLKGQTYQVTAIESNAFKGNKKLKNITIGANIEKIGKSAFEKCSRLTKITIQSSVLTKVEKKALKGVNKKCVIKAPKKKKAAYKKYFKKAGLKSTMKIK